MAKVIYRVSRRYARRKFIMNKKSLSGTRVHFKLNVFAYTLSVMAICWGIMSIAWATKMDIISQLGMLFIAAVVWTMIANAGSTLVRNILIKAKEQQEEDRE